MTKELVKLLTDVTELVKDWNSNAIPTEEEFIEKLKKTVVKIVVELGNQETGKVQTKI